MVKALKHIAGILLASVGVLFILSAIFLVFDTEQTAPLWTVAILVVLLGLFPLAGATLLLWPNITAPTRPCPQCGGIERTPAGLLRSTHNPWLFHFGGWLFGSLWGASREEQVRCARCEKLYLTDTRATRIAGVLVWVFLLILLFGVIAEQVEEERRVIPTRRNGAPARR